MWPSSMTSEVPRLRPVIFSSMALEMMPMSTLVTNRPTMAARDMRIT